jgi:methyl-accepting chemotaxis protein
MGDAEKLTFRRRRKLVNRGFQYRTIATWLIVVLTGFLASTAVLALSYWLVFVRGGGLSAGEIAAQIQLIMPPLLVNDLAIMILVVAVGILTTHRIAGPVYRMQSDIERVLSGELHARVRLRRGDAFPELADKVNELIARLDDARKG